MRELSVVEQRYQAVLAVTSDGETVTDVAARSGCTARLAPCVAGHPASVRACRSVSRRARRGCGSCRCASLSPRGVVSTSARASRRARRRPAVCGGRPCERAALLLRLQRGNRAPPPRRKGPRSARSRACGELRISRRIAATLLIGPIPNAGSATAARNPRPISDLRSESMQMRVVGATPAPSATSYVCRGPRCSSARCGRFTP